MPNHGYCKNCWWWNRTGKTTGHCIMQSYSCVNMVIADENSYCPDYVNREKYTKKHKETLEEFCINTNLPFFTYYELG
jgi:hypothetical protein